MTIRQRLEDNILVAALGIAIATAGAVYSVVTYFDSRQRELIAAQQQLSLSILQKEHNDELQTWKEQVNTLAARVASIERRLGDQKYLDVRQLFTSERGNLKSERKKDILYNAKGKFFALEDAKIWRFENTTELNLITEMTALSEADLPPDLVELTGRSRVFLWRGLEEYNIKNCSFKKIFPYISVQVVSGDFLEKALRLGGKLANSKKNRDFVEESTVVLPAPSDEQQTVEGVGNVLPAFNHFLGTTFRSDVVGIFLTSQLVLFMQSAMFDPSISYRLRNVQKVGPVMYAQIILKLSDVVVNDVQRDIYFVREIFAISRGDGLLAIVTAAVSEDPSYTGTYFDQIGIWLGNFYLPAE